MDLEIILLSEISQTKTNFILLMHGIKKMIQMNLFTEEKQITDIKNELMITTGECRGEG